MVYSILGEFFNESHDTTRGQYATRGTERLVGVKLGRVRVRRIRPRHEFGILSIVLVVKAQLIQLKRYQAVYYGRTRFLRLI